jgi:hypothetical protein
VPSDCDSGGDERAVARMRGRHCGLRSRSSPHKIGALGDRRRAICDCGDRQSADESLGRVGVRFADVQCEVMRASPRQTSSEQSVNNLIPNTG